MKITQIYSIPPGSELRPSIPFPNLSLKGDFGKGPFVAAG